MRSHKKRDLTIKTGFIEQNRQFRGQISRCGSGEPANHYFCTWGERSQSISHQVTELPDDSMPLHGVAHDLADNKTRPRCRALRTGEEM